MRRQAIKIVAQATVIALAAAGVILLL